MSGTGSSKGPQEAQDSSWASETLPLALRKELLERELRRLELHGCRLRRPTGEAAASEAPAAAAAPGQSPSEAPGAPPERPASLDLPCGD